MAFLRSIARNSRFLKNCKFDFELIPLITKRYMNLDNKSNASVQGLHIGDKVTICRNISIEDIQLFAEMTGDFNPVHLTGDKPIVHGALLNGLVSGVIGTKLPGPGTLVLEQTLKFPNKCYVNDMIQVTIELVENRKIMKVIFSCTVDDKVVLEGNAKLLFKR